MKKLVVTLFVSLMALPALADSPLTSTEYYAGYYNNYCLPKPKFSHKKKCGFFDQAFSKKMDAELAAYLIDGRADLGVRLAIINALGWNFDGQDNASVLKAKLLEVKKSELNFDADELIVLGYMQAMDSYLDAEKVSQALINVETGAKSLPKSFAAQLILAVVKGQQSMDKGLWGQVWQDYDAVLQAFPARKRKMPADAVKMITDYMEVYKNY